jgi:hypothetical protein
VRQFDHAIIRNDGVGGSNPSCGTTNLCNYYFNLRPRSPKIGVKFLNVLDTILPPGRRKSPAPAAVSAGSWCRPSTRTIGCLGPFCLRWRTDRRQPDPHSAISREPILQPLFRGAIIVDIFFLRLLHPQDHHRKGPIDVRNPRCPADRFTDRWPENLTAQATYIEDLKLFRQQLAAIMSNGLSLEDKRKLLALMFSEGPARAVVEDFSARLGESVRRGTRRIASTGRVLPAAVAAPTIAGAAAQARGHTFYGSGWPAK